jgi:hypothetical protein
MTDSKQWSVLASIIEKLMFLFFWPSEIRELAERGSLRGPVCQNATNLNVKDHDNVLS